MENASGKRGKRKNGEREKLGKENGKGKEERGKREVGTENGRARMAEVGIDAGE